MNSSHKKCGFYVLALLVSCLLWTPLSQSHPRDQRESLRSSAGGYEGAYHREEGISQASGSFAAWLLGIANLPVALSILLKAAVKVLPQNLNAREPIEIFNRRQKRYLMPFHYWLNPVALIVATIHLIASECETTMFPELGLGVMFLVSVLGLMVTFRWTPATVRKTVFKFHTSPILLLLGISILLIGHSIVD